MLERETIHRDEAVCRDAIYYCLILNFKAIACGVNPPIARTLQRAAGGTGHETTHRQLLFFQSLQAALVRSTTTMAIRLSVPMPTEGTGPDDPSTSAPLPPSRSRSPP